MRAVTVEPGTPGSLRARTDVPEPPPVPGTALVRMLEGGVCGTDAEIDRGLYGEAPPGSPYLIVGHENLGVLVEGPGDGLAPGDLVVSTVRRPCPEGCPPCASGAPDMCLTGHFQERGIRGLHGFHSDFYRERTACLVKVPPSLRRLGVLLEPLTIVEKGIEQAFKIQERLPWRPKTAVVLGAGPVGILGAAALRLRGLDVWVAALEPEGGPKDLFLKEAGIRYISTARAPVATLPQTLGPIDFVLEGTGAPSVVFPATQILGPNGVCVLTSVTGGGSETGVDIARWNRDLVLGNRLVFGTVNAQKRHFEAGLRDLLLAEERLPGWIGRVVTRRVPVLEARAALAKEPSDIKVVLEFV